MDSSKRIPGLRRQYHFRQSSRGVLAWDVYRLIRLAEGLPVNPVPISEIREIDEPYWFADLDTKPTCRQIGEHARLIREVDLTFPILLCHEGRVMDGMHRVLRALIDGADTIKAIRFAGPIEPDYVGRKPEDLPYN